MNRYLFSFIGLVCLYFFDSFILYSQETKVPLDHTVYDNWNTISNARISVDGNWAALTENRYA